MQHLAWHWPLPTVPTSTSHNAQPACPLTQVLYNCIAHIGYPPARATPAGTAVLSTPPAILATRQPRSVGTPNISITIYSGLWWTHRGTGMQLHNGRRRSIVLVGGTRYMHGSVLAQNTPKHTRMKFLHMYEHVYNTRSTQEATRWPDQDLPRHASRQILAPF